MTDKDYNYQVDNNKDKHHKDDKKTKKKKKRKIAFIFVSL